jgi:hypothetical protein
MLFMDSVQCVQECVKGFNVNLTREIVNLTMQAGGADRTAGEERRQGSPGTVLMTERRLL